MHIRVASPVNYDTATLPAHSHCLHYNNTSKGYYPEILDYIAIA